MFGPLTLYAHVVWEHNQGAVQNLCMHLAANAVYHISHRDAGTGGVGWKKSGWAWPTLELLAVV